MMRALLLSAAALGLAASSGPFRAPDWRSLSEGVTDDLLAAADLATPAVRAGHYADAADRLVAALEDPALAAEDRDALARMYEKVLDQGLLPELERADDADDIPEALFVRIDHHREVLVRVLDLTPEPARPGLLRAIEVARRGVEHPHRPSRRPPGPRPGPGPGRRP